MKMEGYKFYVAVQSSDPGNYYTSINFMRFDFTAERGVEEYHEQYAQKATAFRTEIEAMNYAFALNYRNDKRYSKDVYFVVAINESLLPDIQFPAEEE